MDCLDCLRIAVSYSKGEMWCKEDEWIYESGARKIVKLTGAEIRNEKINRRKIFTQAKYCPYFPDRDMEG